MIRPRADLSPRDVCRIFFRHKKKMAVWFVLVVVGVVAFKALTPPTYRSECKLLVRLGRENLALDPTVSLGQGPIVTTPQAREDEINTITEILQSRFLLEKLVDRVGVKTILADAGEADASEPARAARQAGVTGTASVSDLADVWRKRLRPSFTPRESALNQLEGQLDIYGIKKSNIIVLGYRASRPETARKILSALVDLYLDHHVQMHRTPGSLQFFEEQSERLRTQLQTAADEVRDLKNATRIGNIEEQRRILMARIGSLHELQLQAEAELIAAAANVDFLTSQLATLPEQMETARVNGFGGPGAALRDRLHALREQERELLASHGEAHASVAANRQEQDRVQAAIADLGPNSVQITTGLNRAHEEARLTLFQQRALVTTLEAKVEKLAAHRTDSEQALAALNDNEIRLASLERELELKDASYRKYADSLEQARIDEALKLERISNIALAEPPTLETQPVGKSLSFLLGVGAVLGVVGGGALAIFAEQLDHSIKTTQDVEERLELPVLASIPRLSRNRMFANRPGRG